MNLTPLPAFEDNYLWLLQDGQQALVVDPGDAQPVSDFIRSRGLQLVAILVTHHHRDHTGGVEQLRRETGAVVYGPEREPMPEPLTRVGEHDSVEVLGLRFRVLEVPGHTAGHIAYYCDEAVIAGVAAPLLFCGDTLFSGGCGRLFEGSPAQMLASLRKLAALPGDTRVCCTHEYTLSNLKFARTLEPENAELGDYSKRCEELRAGNQPTLPSSIAQERQINPFLRTHEDQVAQAAHTYSGADPQDETAVFAALREWKNGFK